MSLLSILFALINRVIRLWPCLLITLLVYWKISPYLSFGPIWFFHISSIETCDKNGWWRRLLFISNFTNDDCIGWAWYLYVDM